MMQLILIFFSCYDDAADCSGHNMKIFNVHEVIRKCHDMLVTLEMFSCRVWVFHYLRTACAKIYIVVHNSDFF